MQTTALSFGADVNEASSRANKAHQQDLNDKSKAPQHLVVGRAK
ncbi:hypothetical protein [Colwellia sp. MB02u-10]|nr:hypothetical protein [Colwellia sp. MB02u-10]